MNTDRFFEKFLFIAGPCVIEDEAQVMETAEFLQRLCARYPVNLVFKASFDKANRTALNSYRGPGLNEGMRILSQVKARYGLAVLTDVHCVTQVETVARTADVLQIPAFLSRQTDLLCAAGRTGKPVNVKKGQFLAPAHMKYVVEKIESTGNGNILLTERGTCFGYQNLVVDFRSLFIMKKLGYPVIFDATHSLQRPSAAGGISGGDREFAAGLCRAAAACGVDGLFMEVHHAPEKALSDSRTSLSFEGVEDVLKSVLAVRAAVLNEKGSE
ncbi:MAG: 3-deoxy-8-phosphooctulonate synthase [Candidatus Omnitrophica bacterium]|nr:3-deoxy-8-phosphooctulonate synthase [Candidatus Omnitrophota bacterium]